MKTYTANVKVFINGAVWKSQYLQVRATSLNYAIAKASSYAMECSMGDFEEAKMTGKVSLQITVKEEE